MNQKYINICGGYIFFILSESKWDIFFSERCIQAFFCKYEIADICIKSYEYISWREFFNDFDSMSPHSQCCVYNNIFLSFGFILLFVYVYIFHEFMQEDRNMFFIESQSMIHIFVFLLKRC